MRHGTAKLLTLFRPANGELRTKGVTSCTNAVLHGWLQQELNTILAQLPKPATPLSAAASKALWATWTAGPLETNYRVDMYRKILRAEKQWNMAA